MKIASTSWRNNASSFREEPIVDVYFVDVGFGDAQIIAYKDSAIIIDCGPKSQKKPDSPSTNPIVAILMQRNIRRLRALIISHLHEDHYGDALAVLDYFELYGSIDEIIYDVDLADLLPANAKENSSLTHFLERVDELSDDQVVKKQLAPTISNLISDDFWRLELLYPNADDDVVFNENIRWDNPRINATSKILALNVEGAHRVLFTGDAPFPSFEKIFERLGRLNLDVIAAPHHGLSINASPDKAKRLYEEFIVTDNVFFSVGPSRHKAPSSEIVKSVTAAGSCALCSQATTCLPKAKVCEWYKFRVDFFQKNEPDYWLMNADRSERVCAGTILAHINRSSVEIDGLENYLAFRHSAAQKLNLTLPCAPPSESEV